MRGFEGRASRGCGGLWVLGLLAGGPVFWGRDGDPRPWVMFWLRMITGRTFLRCSIDSLLGAGYCIFQ